MLQCVCSIVDHSWRQSVVRTKKPCGLDVTISASCDWSVAIFTTSLESQESYLTLRNLTLQTCLSITRDCFRLHSTFARLYIAAASPASRLRSAGSLAIISYLARPRRIIVKYTCCFILFCFVGCRIRGFSSSLAAPFLRCILLYFL